MTGTASSDILHHDGAFSGAQWMIKADEARVLLDSITTAVLLVDGRLNLLAINQAAEDLLSISSRKARGLPLGRLLPDAALLSSALKRAVAAGDPFTEREMILTVPGPRSVTVDCTVTPVLEPPRAPLLVVELFNMDRHQRIVREETMLAQQQVSNALVRGMAHEIKNPLGGLRGAAQLLERELDREELKEYTRIIIAEADRLRGLVDRMLGPSSLPHRRPVNIHEVLEHVRSLVEAEAPQGIQVSRDYDPSLPDIKADRDQLVQAVLNIARNAVQAMGRKGEMLLRTRAQRQFTIGSRRYKTVIRVDIVDNGPGIPWDIKDGIFYPMVTGTKGGTGLGLSIAQSLVHHNGGLIEFDSQPGRTTFTIWLPLDAEG